ncbi:UDP-N-acetylglucosamine 1-carboxyvinyltransferase [Paenibacillus hemerocallicola]|uniref:UDP-N-acetylglucosamine 1-carboxyvinyltransferase n=1 Tax=Paenibacillus hemerocallicola TaxID=1172614 RepID=A0A5C4TF09_9BACL|nr:UDP-N-acetylglucosamine 1-carboxyvinyltransferase [Paenibacillus hemerocallicola]TNJ67402.1 UDP-N-acetylglucosamine 1-carboxyvinyltransferase [Paenibacillus hemerocallicola]
MNIIRLERSGPASGSVKIQGSKNSSLSLMAACCLSDAPVTLSGIPDIYDIRVICEIADRIGMKTVRHPNGDITLDPTKIHNADIDKEKASSYRASYYFVGALLAKFGKVSIGFPGGDNFVSRPIDQHVKGLTAMGAEFSFHEDHYTVTAKKLTGADIYFDTITSGATINCMLAAVLAEGRTVLRGAAKDPEVVDTAIMLNAFGAKISGAGTDTIRIDGVRSLAGGQHTVIPDRLIAGAFLMTAGITGGSVTVTDVIPDHLGSCIAKLTEIGLQFEFGDQSITAVSTGTLKATRVRTAMYPGFATDLQQPLTALLTQAQGRSIINEKIYPKRFQHVAQLRRMGADIDMRGSAAFIRGGAPLKGSWVHASDIRAGTCLILAGLAADGPTHITGVEHIERGYEDALAAFRSIGVRLSLEQVDAAHAEEKLRIGSAKL